MLLRTLSTGILLTAGAFAQVSSFPKPSYFRETFSKTQPKVELKDPVRLKDFVVGDKLELSLKDYLALVVANNTDIQIQMLSLETPKNAIQRAFGAWDPRATAQFTNDPRDHAAHQRAGRQQRRDQDAEPAVEHERHATVAYRHQLYGVVGRFEEHQQQQLQQLQPGAVEQPGDRRSASPCCRTAALTSTTSA